MRRRAAMTLIEVVVALAILAVIGAMALGALASTLAARDALEANDHVQQSARVALGRITRDIELAWLHRDATTVNTYRTLFVGKDADPTDRMWFTTLNHHRLYRDARESDQTEVTIWLEDDPNDDDLYVLMHREAPRIDHEPDKQGVIYPLAYGVKRFTVRYLDGKSCEFLDEWDSTGPDQADRLPRAVQLVLTLMGPDPDDEDEKVEHSFATTILLRYGGKARCDLFGDDEQGG